MRASWPAILAVLISLVLVMQVLILIKFQSFSELQPFNPLAKLSSQANSHEADLGSPDKDPKPLTSHSHHRPSHLRHSEEHGRSSEPAEPARHRRPVSPPPPVSDIPVPASKVEDGVNRRIGVVIPYVGHDLPKWFPFFAESCRISAPLIDWLIVCSGTKTPPQTAPWLPPNVKFFPVSIEEMGRLHARLFDSESDRKTASKYFTHLLQSRPYYLVEYKPAIGHIFAEYLTEYSHWAFGDLDVLAGDMGGFTEVEELDLFDVHTFTFGDQFRMYTRGQWTVQRNTPEVNQLWRKCDFLTHQLMQRIRSASRYQSAEGCYALQVAQSDSVSAKYAVKAFTDAEGRGDSGAEAYLAWGHVLKEAHPSKDQPSKDTIRFLLSDELSSLSGPYQTEMGPFQPAVRSAKQRCMFWVSPSYQTCMDSVPQSRNLYRFNGSSFQRDYQSTVVHSAPSVNLVSGAFFHFQEWKKQYQSWSLSYPALGLSRQPIMMTRHAFHPLPPLPHTAAAGEEEISPWVHRHLSALSYCAQLSNDHCSLKLAFNDPSVVSTGGKPFVRSQDETKEESPKQTSPSSTVALAMVVEAAELKRISAALERWQGPQSIVVISRSHSESSSVASVTKSWRGATVREQRLDPGARACYHGLMNLAMDALTSRFVLPLFPGQMVTSSAHSTLTQLAETLSTRSVTRHGPHLVLLKALEPTNCNASMQALFDGDSPELGAFPTHTFKCRGETPHASSWSLEPAGSAGTRAVHQVMEPSQHSPNHPFLLDLSTPLGRMPVRFPEEIPASCFGSLLPWSAEQIGLTVHVQESEPLVLYTGWQHPCPSSLSASKLRRTWDGYRGYIGRSRRIYRSALESQEE